MRILRRYRTEVEAEQVAMHLRGLGIKVGVFGAGTSLSRGAFGLATPTVDLVLLESGQASEAESALSGLEASRAELEAGWEEAAEPDVSMLDVSLVPIDCPECGASLTIDVNVVECGGCGALTDAVERIVALHGPEGLIRAMGDGGVGDGGGHGDVGAG